MALELEPIYQQQIDPHLSTGVSRQQIKKSQLLPGLEKTESCTHVPNFQNAGQGFGLLHQSAEGA